MESESRVQAYRNKPRELRQKATDFPLADISTELARILSNDGLSPRVENPVWWPSTCAGHGEAGLPKELVGKRIVVVDDTAIVRLDLENTLREAGATIL